MNSYVRGSDLASTPTTLWEDLI